MRTRMKLYVALAAAAMLSGCQDKPVSEMSYSDIKSLSLELHKRCWAEGVKSGTPEMNVCLQQEFTRESSLRDQRMETRQAIGAALIANGQTYHPYTAPAYRPTTCTSSASSTFVGGAPSQVRTTCY